MQYQNIETLYKAISKLYELFKTKNSFHYEQDLDKLFFQNMDFFSNMVFDKTRIKSHSEKSILQKEFKVRQIVPLVHVEGLLYLTNKRVYFQPYHSIYQKPVINFKIKDIKELFKRRYKLLNIGIEFLCSQKKKGIYVTFQNTYERDIFYNALLALVEKNENECITTDQSLINFTTQWVNGGLSNFDYLMLLNQYAQRSLQDLTQYPVFPWIIKNYKSEVLDLQDENNFRDLSKPIGALNKKRLDEFVQRYYEYPD